jgi:hypothetical protein
MRGFFFGCTASEVPSLDSDSGSVLSSSTRALFRPWAVLSDWFQYNKCSTSYLKYITWCACRIAVISLGSLRHHAAIALVTETWHTTLGCFLRFLHGCFNQVLLREDQKEGASQAFATSGTTLVRLLTISVDIRFNLRRTANSDLSADLPLCHAEASIIPQNHSSVPRTGFHWEYMHVSLSMLLIDDNAAQESQSIRTQQHPTATTTTILQL